MDKEFVKSIFKNIQQKLDSLQNSGATFLFIGDEGNHFVIGGDFNAIVAQLLFAMIRYPVIRKIIYRCVERYEESEKLYGDDIRNVKMQHLIEQNSGNDDN